MAVFYKKSYWKRELKDAALLTTEVTSMRRLINQKNLEAVKTSLLNAKKMTKTSIFTNPMTYRCFSNIINLFFDILISSWLFFFKFLPV